LSVVAGPATRKGAELLVARSAPRRKASRRRAAGRAGWNAVGLVLFVALVFPVYWMVTSAFKLETDINALNPSFVPTNPTTMHFSNAMHRAYFWTDVKNTVIIVGFTVAISMVLAFLAAVALAKFRFTGRKLFIVLMIGIQMLPQVGLIIPLFVVLRNYHQINTLSGVIITYMTFVLPFSVWVLRGFIIGIPRELEEAAMVDGNSRLGAFVKILLPLVAPGLVATSIFAFITSWNEFLFASVFLQDQSKQTVTVWLSYFYGLTTGPTPWGDLMAASTLTAIPAVVFFILVQRRIAFGLTAGAVKA
jgi:N,N'-diacetylchitobiose transport system permease protein